MGPPGGWGVTRRVRDTYHHEPLGPLVPEGALRRQLQHDDRVGKGPRVRAVHVHRRPGLLCGHAGAERGLQDADAGGAGVRRGGEVREAVGRRQPEGEVAGEACSRGRERKTHTDD